MVKRIAFSSLALVGLGYVALPVGAYAQLTAASTTAIFQSGIDTVTDVLSPTLIVIFGFLFSIMALLWLWRFVRKSIGRAK